MGIEFFFRYHKFARKCLFYLGNQIRPNAVIRILPQQTSIVTDNKASAILELAWVLESRFSFARVELQLDRNMLAKPTNYEHTVGFDLSLGWPSISVNSPTYVVNQDRRKVRFNIQNASAFGTTKNSIQKIPIDFEWRNPHSPPQRIDIKVSVKMGLSELEPTTLTGFNCEGSAIEFLRHREESAFYFPSACSVLELPYWEFAKSAASYQSAPNSTVKAVSWPTELGYWLSPEGTEYLVSQVRKIEPTDRRSLPTRIVICPLELGTGTTDGALFLQEMEVHFRLGVNVRTVSPKLVFDLLKGELSIATYGGGLALEFHGTGSELSKGSLAVMLEQHRIEDTVLRLAEIQSLSEPWPKYLQRIGMDFSSEESGIAVFNRYHYIQNLLRRTNPE